MPFSYSGHALISTPSVDWNIFRRLLLIPNFGFQRKLVVIWQRSYVSTQNFISNFFHVYFPFCQNIANICSFFDAWKAFFISKRRLVCYFLVFVSGSSHCYREEWYFYRTVPWRQRAEKVFLFWYVHVDHRCSQEGSSIIWFFTTRNVSSAREVQDSFGLVF